MKSKELKIYNIPREVPPMLTLTVKPTQFISIILFLSIGLMFLFSAYSVLFLSVIAVCLFALVAMPDRTLLEIYNNLLVVYDSRQINTCYCIYWEELLNWQYVKSADGDKIIFVLIDGQEIKSDIYRSSNLFILLNTFAKGKEKKVAKKRREYFNNRG